MSNDPTLAEETPPEAPDDSGKETQLARLGAVHADRVRQLEADRWRMSERIEALEAQNGDLQAGFLEQANTWERQLRQARQALEEERQCHVASQAQARAQEADRIETVRRELGLALTHHESRGERFLKELLEAKDALITQGREYHAAFVEQQDSTARQLAELRRELGAERESLQSALAQLLESKVEATKSQQAHASLLQVEQQVRLDLERERKQALQQATLPSASTIALAQEKKRADEAERQLATSVTTLKALRDRLQPLERQPKNATEGPLSSDAEIERLKRALSHMEAEAKRQRQALLHLESQAEKSKDTLSYRLGYLLIHAPKSLAGLRRLPNDLLDLHQEARRRRAARRGDGSKTSSAESTQARKKSPARAVEETRAAELFAEETMRLFLTDGVAAAARFAESGGSNDHDRAIALTRLAKATKTSDAALAATLADRAYALEALPFRAKWLAFALYDAGAISRPAALLAALPFDFALKPSEKARIAEIAGLARVQVSLPRVPDTAAQTYEPDASCSLYVTASALPFHVSGYTVRTHALVQAVAATGWQIRPTLRPGYPADRGVVLPKGTSRHVADGMSYEHVSGPHVRRTGLDEFVEAAATGIVDAATRVRAAVIHAASNHVNALPALIAARRLGVPFVYEVRGLWEMTAATRVAGWEETERFALERDLEALVARNADHVFTLTAGLTDELVSRGTERGRIEMLPNCVDPQRFAPRRKDPELVLRFGLNASAFTLVYAGSLLHYEGLDDLVRALAKLVAEGIEATLVVAGDGEALPELQRLAAELGVERRVKLLGRLAPDEIPGIWSLADAAAFPRKPFQVCQLVSPLKPLEPMAMGIAVVVSDVSALSEMVQPGQTGLTHRAGDSDDLSARLLELARDSSLRQRLGRSAREAVLRERTWQTAGARVVAAYRRLTSGEAVAPVALSGGRTSMSSDEKMLFETRLEQAYQRGGAESARDLAIRQAGGRSDRLLAFCLLKAASCCQRFADTQAVELARAALANDESATTLRGVARIVYASGNFAEAADVVDRLEQSIGALTGKDDELAREVRGRSRVLSLLAAGALSERLPPPIPGRSVYFLHFSLPYMSVGYATRSHGLIAGMQAAGCDVRPYTRCGFPFDAKPELEGQQIPESDLVDGIEYRRLLAGSRRGGTESEYLLACAEAYERVLRAERPEVVHAASNYVTALPALIAARRLGLPFIYEIRGFWEITRASRDNDFENSTRYSLMRHFEGVVAKEADHVYTLTSAMKDELVRRGVHADKITLVHNGVDAERFLPLAPRRELAEQLGLPPDVPVIGYVGSFVDYEGLDDLIRACCLLARRGVDFRLLMVGDGAELPGLRALVANEGVADRVLLTGRVPHDSVEAFYSLIDICPFPRKPWEVCEMVSPLKPFEAMAMQKAVVVSSTHALREIVEDGHTGLVFEKGNPEALAACLERLVRDPELRARLAATGRRWALENRTWKEGGRIVVAGYRALLAARSTSGSTRIPA